MDNNAIEIEGVRFAYGRNEVLRGVDLQVPAGSIFGFLGRNGAGKTTAIKLLLGLLKPKSGVCRVQGIDPQVDEVGVRRAVGYMAEDQQMYGWMRVGEISRWVGSFYPDWDEQIIERLLGMFELDRKKKVKHLSKGQNGLLALLLALGHRPKVVILDDPTLGLDPIARKDFLRHVIELMQSNGVTVFFSSHLLYEIEPVADRVAILDKGVIVKTSKTEQLRESVRKFIVVPKGEVKIGEMAGVLDVVDSKGSVSVTIEDCDRAKRAELEAMSANGVTEVALNLDEIFEAYVIGNRGESGRLC
jgi:ABC-2 type transport system ATP-binding protein